GVMHMLSHGITADFGVIFKPWDEVYYEHPGMVWFKVTTWGSMGYSGIPRGIPEFRSSIVPGARVILDLEKWLSEYPEGHMSAQIKPEGWIAAVRAGWPDKPAFPSAACEIYVDLRTNPDQSMAEIEAEFGAAMREIVARHDDVEATWETFVTCRGSRTEPDNWIIQSALRGWESVHERSYPGAEMLSGQTDAATICQMGLPLVRIGYPWVGDKDMPKEFSDGLGGMGVAFIPDLIDPMRHLIYILIDSCTRTREEVGLKHG
ncbi:MAG: acetylornithine deacetylase, partial [Gammaproteobacteria bacterium]|nr:acetylornithine deacetylase [Gammaproteobacteria bacterium]